MHESMHMLQEFRYGNNAMRGLLNWSVFSTAPRSRWIVPNFIMGYVLNPVEIGARNAGLLSLSINLVTDPVLRMLQSAIHVDSNR